MGCRIPYLFWHNTAPKVSSEASENKKNCFPYSGKISIGALTKWSVSALKAISCLVFHSNFTLCLAVPSMIAPVN